MNRPQTGDPTETQPPPSVDRWLGALLDLSMKNPLMSIEGTGVPLFVDEVTLPGIEDVVAEGREIHVRGVEDLDDFADDPDSRDELGIDESARGAADLSAGAIMAIVDAESTMFARSESRELRTKLSAQLRQAQTVREETGASPLYFTIGALRYTAESGASVIAPLYLLPIELRRTRPGAYAFSLSPGATVRANESLLELLRRTYRFEPDVLRDPPLDDSGIDLPGIFTTLRSQLAGRFLPFEVVADARLAILKFSTMDLWRDLRHNWVTFGENPLVKHLVEASGEPFADPVPEPPSSDTDAAEMALPLPADGSQIQAVRWASAGRTFVLEGPPGTGKSQTIANMIADAIHRGRRVLFVAEKEAALDVVARRLRAAGLDDVCLDVYSKDQTARGARIKLLNALRRGVAETRSDAFGALRARQRALMEALAEYPREVCAAHGAPGLVPDVTLDPLGRRAQVEEFREVTSRVRGMIVPELKADVALRAATTGLLGDMRLRRDLGVAHADGLRELFNDHIDAVLSLTPCLLMSPSTVAQFLPARSGLVDLVIFDEASQIRVASAVGALGRASSAVIVGDVKQMPPSDLFRPDSVLDDADEEQESILLEAHAVNLPSLQLTWHYRSRGEGLVSFSNERYYDGDLASFPTAPRAFAGTGVEFRRVPGRHEARRNKPKANLIERDAVVGEATRLLEADPGASVGIVTFNNSQRDVILDKLEDEDASEVVKAALAREHEPLFVKSVENVQGDERDHILFSFTYSPDEKGYLTQNFGFLTKAGGERRLNVAVTRARLRNVAFCSFDPEHVNTSSKSQGPAHLREYLMAAREGDAQLGGAAVGPRAEEGVGARGGAGPSTAAGAGAHPVHASPSAVAGLDSYRAEIAGALRAVGLEIVEDVGLSSFRVDLAVRAAGRPWIAVMLDSPQWAGRAAVGDRDDLPYAVLGGGRLGWAAVHQVYRTEWASPEQVVARIQGLAAEAEGRARVVIDAPARSATDDSPAHGASAEPEVPMKPVSSVAPPTPDAPPLAALPSPDAPPLAALPTPEGPPLPPAVPRPSVARAVEPEPKVTPARVVAADTRAASVTADTLRAVKAQARAVERLDVGLPTPAEIVVTPFVSAREPKIGTRDDVESLPARAAMATVSEQWREIVGEEGPVLADRAGRNIARRFGIRRLTWRYRKKLELALPRDIQRSTHGDQVFLWPPGVDPATYRLVRTGPTASRKAEEIVPVEFENAVRSVLGESAGECSERDLFRGVKEIFGFGRLGSNIKAQIEAALTALEAAGELTREAGQVVATADTTGGQPARDRPVARWGR